MFSSNECYFALVVKDGRRIYRGLAAQRRQNHYINRTSISLPISRHRRRGNSLGLPLYVSLGSGTELIMVTSEGVSTA